jgi:methylthioribulose-1-phosphate dehydratase
MPLTGHEERIDQLRECGSFFHQRGWSVGTSSNYSVVLSNDPVELIVAASGKDKGRLAATDFVHVGADGAPIESDQPKSSAETMLHVVLAELGDVGCILHTHSVWGTLLSDYFFDEGGFEFAGYEMLKGLEGIPTHDTTHWLPIFENTQDIPSLAKDVRARLNDPMESMTHGFLIRRHGLYTWGKDVFAARRHVEIYEFLFECLARKMTLPPK